jgi:hypothetical protein
MVLALLTRPPKPPCTRMPVALSTLLKLMAPALVTRLFEFWVTAAPAADRVIEPPAAMVRSPVVEVATGTVVPVEIVVCAKAGAACSSGSTAAERNRRFMDIPELRVDRAKTPGRQRGLCYM